MALLADRIANLATVLPVRAGRMAVVIAHLPKVSANAPQKMSDLGDHGKRGMIESSIGIRFPYDWLVVVRTGTENPGSRHFHC